MKLLWVRYSIQRIDETFSVRGPAQMMQNSKLVKRPYYSNWLERWRGKKVIKILTGLRRCGKSTLLELFQDKLREQGVAQENILAINFESMEEQYPAQARELYGYIAARLSKGMNYVFLDEIQHVEHFEQAVDALYVRDDVDVYITGSNAKLLSGELATLLTGRYVELQVLPYSFKEFQGTRQSGEPIERSFEHYLTYGGLPYAAKLESDRDIADYLGGVFNTILIKDIAIRRPGINMRAFNEVVSFLADNVGNLTSVNGIAKQLRQEHRGMSANTVDDYVQALRENYLLFRADRYDIKGKAYLKTLEKYYLADLGFRFCLLGRTGGDVGHRLENVVYLELLRRYQSVHVGKVDSGEVDFYASGTDGNAYYQVSATVLDPATLERELAALRNINDNYPKTLLTLDTIGNGEHAGINQTNVIDWLLR